MKIIGKTGERTYLIEAHEDEIARVTGHSYIHSTGAPGAESMRRDHYGSLQYRYPIGTSIEVSLMWDWMKKAREQFEKVLSTAKMLAGVAEILANAPPVALVEPPEEEK